MSDEHDLIGTLHDHARNHPGRWAVVSPRVRLTYDGLARRVAAQASVLERRGLGSPVGIHCADEVRHLQLCLALTRIGLASFTLPSHESPEQRTALLAATGAAAVVEEGDAIDPADSDPADSNPVDFEAGTEPDLAQPETAGGAPLLFTTSGTTGEAKIVVHSDANLVAQAPRHVSPGERFACLGSIEHNFAKRHRLYCVAVGATNVFVDRRLGPPLEQCRALEIDTLHLTAYQAQELLAQASPGEWRGTRIKLGGSHVPVALRQQLRAEVTDTLQCGYGTTETGAICFTDAGDARVDESVGRALPGMEIRILGAEEGASTRGEVAIRCAGMFSGYLGRPDRTAARLVDGWFHTGDLGYLDDERRLHLCGRADDMFVFNSLNIYPQDVEAQICAHPGVADAAVLPRHSAVHGDVPVALVVFSPTAEGDVASLKKALRAELGLRSPRQITVVDRIPRNGAGKILRREARALLEGGEGRP